MMKAGLKASQRMLAAASVLCALIASLAIAVAPAAAEEATGFLDFQPITSASGAEEYSWNLHLQPGETLVQLNDTEAAIEDGTGTAVSVIVVAPARDANGAAVPVTLRVDPEVVITEIVHHQASDPLSTGATFAYPITAGESFTTGAVSVSAVLPPGALAKANQAVIEASPPAQAEPPPAITCKVPTLHGYSLRGAKNRLRTAHCGIGAVHLVTGATAAKGKVVKQFRAAGTELAAGAPVAVKLGAGASR